MNNKPQFETNTDRPSRLRRLGLVLAGVGLGSTLAYFLSKALGGQRESFRPRQSPEHIVDDRGTGQDKAFQMIRKLRDRAFDASDERLALALGRPIAEVTAWNAGEEVIDADVVMKVRGIAMNRGVHLD